MKRMDEEWITKEDSDGILYYGRQKERLRKKCFEDISKYPVKMEVLLRFRINLHRTHHLAVVITTIVIYNNINVDSNNNKNYYYNSNFYFVNFHDMGLNHLW